MREHLFFTFLVVPGVGNVRFYYFSSFPHAGNPIFFVFARSRGREQAFFRNPGVPGGRNKAFFIILREYYWNGITKHPV